jgi:hypothetical protein
MCTYNDRHQPATQFAFYTAGYPTGVVTRAVGKGTDSGQSTTATTITFTPTVGGRNGTANFRINSATTFCTDIAIQVWDVKPPHNATINTTNMTNFTQGNLHIFVFGADNTHIIAEELYTNVSGAWQLTSFINSTASRIANRSYGFNFTISVSEIIGSTTQCFLAAAGIRDSANNLNMSGNSTFCVNQTVSEYSIQEDPLSCNFPNPIQNQSVPVLCTSNNGTGAQITNSLIRCQAYWAGNFSTAPLSVQPASNAVHTTNGTYAWMFNPPIPGAMYTVNCSAAFAVTANAPAAPAGTIFVFPKFAEQDNTSQILADMAVNTTAIINNQAFSNNSLHAALGLNSSNVISTIVIGNNTIHLALAGNASNIIFTTVSANNTVLQQMAANSSFLLGQMGGNASNIIFTIVTANNTLLAAYADNTSNVINTIVFGNNSLNSNLALNYTALKSLIEESNSSVSTQANITTLLGIMNAELKIQAFPAQSFYNNSDLLIEFAFSNNTGAFSSLDTLSIQLVQANGTVYNQTYATTVGLVNGTYLYNVSINENNSGIWTVRVNATKNGVTAISSYNLRLYGGVFMFSITTDQNVYDTVTGTIFLLNEGADNTEDGTLETWVSTSATCAPVMDGTYASEQLKPPAVGDTKLLTRPKSFQRLQDTLYYCGKWTYADYQTASATAAFTVAVAASGSNTFPWMPAIPGIPLSISACENLAGFDEFVCDAEVWLSGRDLSFSKSGYVPNFLIIVLVLVFFIFLLFRRKHYKSSIVLSALITFLLWRYFGKA